MEWINACQENKKYSMKYNSFFLILKRKKINIFGHEISTSFSLGQQKKIYKHQFRF